MLASIPGFFRLIEVCWKNFETLFRLYRKENVANSILGNDKHEFKFYDYFYQWWHQASSVMKHVNVTTMDSTNGDAQDNCDYTNQDISQDIQIECNSQSEPSSYSKKNKFQDQAYFTSERW